MLASPRNLRETFGLLARLHCTDRLETLLDQVDWSGVTPQQLSYAVLGRLREGLHYAGRTGAPFDAKAYFIALLHDTAFQADIVVNLLRAFPEKPRRFFVHVPRCGGTSLGETLAAHACTIPHNTIGADWSGGRDFLDHVAEICRAMPGHEAIHVSGHYTLRFVFDARLTRFGDSIWTSVRPPQEIVLSFMNYILTILHEDPQRIRPDTRHWARLLDLDRPFCVLSDRDRRALFGRLIRDRRLIPRDLLSNFLGDGTAASAMDLLASSDAEIIDSARLDHWRGRRWATDPLIRRNVSRRFFSWDTLDAAQRRQVCSLIREDSVLHDAIAAATGDNVSIRGMAVAGSADRAALRANAPRRGIKRASRPILLDARFGRLPSAEVGWADPPLDYRTIETTMRFPLVDTRIRLRFTRRPPDTEFGVGWPRGVLRLFGRMMTMLRQRRAG
ncbi:hypothetical protein [Lichenicoccus sp.]|uniref:hypothetical protein n=1 Tax=Lichenicoccus sp. TaxID=2781899 RepID=UPI003D09ADDA